MSKTLGIDLGTSSLGWAILDDERLMDAPVGEMAPSAIDCGVVIFPEGMERDKSGSLKSRAAERRTARAARRLIFRRKLRKLLLLQELQKRGMCPISQESVEAWKHGEYPVNDKAFREWLASTPEKNPYADRKRAAEGKVDPFTLGRALYHIAQRRGFKSSRKEQLQELLAEEARHESKKAKVQTDLGVVKEGIQKLTDELGGRTLGQYFYDLFQTGGKIRGRYIGRIEHYEKEFECIATRQELDSETIGVFRKILFSQRRLRGQGHLIGWCELEHGQKYHRCVVSHPSYEAFAAWGFINSIRAGEEKRALTDDERKVVFSILKRRTALKAGDLQKAILKKMRTFPLPLTHRDESLAPVMSTTAQFEELGIPQNEWQTAFNALLDFDDLKMLKDWAAKRYGFNEKNALKFIKTNPSEDRGRCSLHAITKILPWLERGYLNHKAVFFAKLPDVVHNFAANKELVIADLEREELVYHKEKEQAAKLQHPPKIMPLEDGRWRTCLMTKWGVSEDGYKQLYISRDTCNEDDPVLPAIDLGSYNNPLVQRSLTILRRLINKLRRKKMIDADTRINIELAREVNSSNDCRAIEIYQRNRQKQRQEAHDKLQDILTGNNINKELSDDLILRYMLWVEQDMFSVYTGQPISARQMVLECDIEHTLPRSIGGTSELENLTLCEPHYNRDVKKGKLPTECPNATSHWKDPATDIEYPPLENGKVLDGWQKKLVDLEKQLKKRPVRGADIEAYNRNRQNWLVTKMERDYLKRKLSFFKLTRTRTQEIGFIPRQLVDTGAMTRRAVAYLKTRYLYVYPTNGQTTAFARKEWGLQSDEKKDRTDHTHHAKDAIVIAALTRANYQSICSYYKNLDERSVKPTIPAPYPNFAEHVRHAIDSILVRQLRQNCQRKPYAEAAKRLGVRLANPVRHKLETGETQAITKVTACGSTVRGTLHTATIYGRITLPGTDEVVTVVRKTIADAGKGEDLKKLALTAVDETVGKSLLAQIEAYEAAGVKSNELAGKEYWLNKEKGVRLLKVRVKMSKPANPVALRKQVFGGHTPVQENVYVSSIPVLGMFGRKVGTDKWETNSVSLLEAVLNKTKLGEVSDRENGFLLYPGQFVLTYQDSPQELKQLSAKELSKRLYVVVQAFGERKAIFKFHRETRSTTALKAVLPTMTDCETHQPLKANGESKINYKHPYPLLLLGVNTFANHMLFEGRDFRFGMDGTMEWIES